MLTIRIEIQVRDERSDQLYWQEVAVAPDQGRRPRVELSAWFHDSDPEPVAGRYRALTERGTAYAQFRPVAVAA